MAGISLVVAVPTLVCSALSLLASSTFALFYVLFPPARHFRQALIVNLLIADLLNSLNNTISGAIAISRRNDVHPLPAGPACTANGYIGQFSVQAIDFNILVISWIVLITVRQPRFMIAPPWWQVLVVCAIPWIPPIITSNIALGLGVYGPVSGNWCWISADYFKLRYALTHGWRLAIIVTTIAFYTYIYIFLMRAYGRLGVGPSTSQYSTDQNSTVLSDLPPPKSYGRSRYGATIDTVRHSQDKTPLQPTATISHDEDPSELPPRRLSRFSRHYANDTMAPTAQARKQALRKMLLLNGYPILYVILWIPGIANRIAEGVGTSPLWLRILQCSTQLVGFANALTYAYNEQLLVNLRASWRR